MKCKGSYYNFKCTNDNGELLIMNMRTQASIKIKKEDKDFIESLLVSDTCTELDACKYTGLISGGFVIPDEFDEIKWLEMKNNEVIYGNDTLSVEIIPTDDCNLRCTYCFEQRMPSCLDEENEIKIINFLKKQIPKCKQFRLSWFGGEPLLYPEQVIRISEVANDLCRENKVPMFGEISTNGYNLDVQIFQQLIRNRITEFQICLDGPERFHNKSRPHYKNNDSYYKILNNLIAIKEQVKSGCFKIAIRTNVTPTIEPYMDEHLSELAKYFKDDKRFMVLFQCVRDWGGDRVSDEQIVANEQAVYKRLYRLASEKGLNAAGELNFAPMIGYCRANRRNGFVIDYEAKIHKCSLSMHSSEFRDIGNIGYISDSGKAIIDEGKQAKWLVSSPIKESCTKCVLYPFCMGGHCFYSRNIQEKTKCNLYILTMVKEHLYSLDNNNQINMLTIR